jgi:hypothetical protein
MAGDGRAVVAGIAALVLVAVRLAEVLLERAVVIEVEDGVVVVVVVVVAGVSRGVAGGSRWTRGSASSKIESG